MSVSPDSRWQGLAAALGLAMAPLVALGFTRFAYALLLPPMLNEFGWSFVKAGALNASNAIGYLVGALLAAWMGRRWGKLQTFTWAMVVSALALMATAWPSNFSLLLAVRAVGGMATADGVCARNIAGRQRHARSCSHGLVDLLCRVGSGHYAGGHTDSHSAGQ